MFNRIIEICMRNRLLVLAAFILIALAGWWALKNTPVDAIPDIGENQVIVFADWPGRSPQDIQDQVIYPLSIAMQGIPDVKYVRSTSMFSFGYINIIFKDEVDFYWARTRVLEKMNTAIKDMPEGVYAVPRFSEHLREPIVQMFCSGHMWNYPQNRQFQEALDVLDGAYRHVQVLHEECERYAQEDPENAAYQEVQPLVRGYGRIRRDPGTYQSDERRN